MTITKEKRSTTNGSANAPKAGRREWIGLGVLALAPVLSLTTERRQGEEGGLTDDDLYRTPIDI